MPRVKARHADHRRILRIRLARDQRLQGLHQGAARHHHIHRLMRHGGVPATAGDRDAKAVRARHHRPFGDAETARGQPRPVMQTEYTRHREALEQAFFDHHPAAAFVLFGGLKNEIHRAVKIAHGG